MGKYQYNDAAEFPLTGGHVMALDQYREEFPKCEFMLTPRSDEARNKGRWVLIVKTTEGNQFLMVLNFTGYELERQEL